MLTTCLSPILQYIWQLERTKTTQDSLVMIDTHGIYIYMYIYTLIIVFLL
jgi:hypothetical protein